MNPSFAFNNGISLSLTTPVERVVNSLSSATTDEVRNRAVSHAPSLFEKEADYKRCDSLYLRMRLTGCSHEDILSTFRVLQKCEQDNSIKKFSSKDLEFIIDDVYYETETFKSLSFNSVTFMAVVQGIDRRKVVREQAAALLLRFDSIKNIIRIEDEVEIVPMEAEMTLNSLEDLEEDLDSDPYSEERIVPYATAFFKRMKGTSDTKKSGKSGKKKCVIMKDILKAVSNSAEITEQLLVQAKSAFSYRVGGLSRANSGYSRSKYVAPGVVWSAGGGAEATEHSLLLWSDMSYVFGTNALYYSVASGGNLCSVPALRFIEGHRYYAPMLFRKPGHIGDVYTNPYFFAEFCPRRMLPEYEGTWSGYLATKTADSYAEVKADFEECYNYIFGGHRNNFRETPLVSKSGISVALILYIEAKDSLDTVLKNEFSRLAERDPEFSPLDLPFAVLGNGKSFVTVPGNKSAVSTDVDRFNKFRGILLDPASMRSMAILMPWILQFGILDAVGGSGMMDFAGPFLPIVPDKIQELERAVTACYFASMLVSLCYLGKLDKSIALDWLERYKDTIRVNKYYEHEVLSRALHLYGRDRKYFVLGGSGVDKHPIVTNHVKNLKSNKKYSRYNMFVDPESKSNFFGDLIPRVGFSGFGFAKISENEGFASNAPTPSVISENVPPPIVEIPNNESPPPPSIGIVDTFKHALGENDGTVDRGGLG